MEQHVLIHPETGAPEAFSPESVQGAMRAGYNVPIMDKNGNPAAVSVDQARKFVAAGTHRQPTPDELNNMMMTAHYDTPVQQGIAFAEGMFKGIAPGVAPLIESSVMPTTLEDIGNREKVHPGTNLFGEVAGMATGAALLPEASLPGLISKMGTAAAAGVAAEGIFGAVAKKAVQGVVEGAMYSAANQAHEALLGNPDEVAEHLLSNIGFSAMIGGGLGVALSPISKAALKFTGEGAASKIEAAKSLVEKTAKYAKNTPIGEAAEILAWTVGHKAMATIKTVNMAKKFITEALARGGEEASPLMGALLKANQFSAKVVGKMESTAANIFEKAGMVSTGAAGYVTSRAYKLDDGPEHEREEDKDYHPAIEGMTELASNPEALINHIANGTSEISALMPNVSTALATKISNVLNIATNAIPKNDKLAPLDPTMPPTTMQKNDLIRTLNVLDDPLSLMKHAKDGTIMPQHIAAVSMAYPILHANMQQAVLSKLTDHLSKNPISSIPYKTRLGLSQFLGQNLDSTMSQQAILSNQMALGQIAQQKANQEAAQMKPSKSGMGKMNFNSEKTRYQQSASRGAK